MSPRPQREALMELMQQDATTVRHLTRAIAETVTSARNHGATWQEIGDALAITKQAAQQRFGHKNHWTAADTAAGQTPSMFTYSDGATSQPRG